VGLFRRREPLHEKLAREGGLVPADLDPRPGWQETGVHGLQRPREWDATVTTEADVEGDRVTFLALPDGTLLIEDGPDDVAPLATAVEAVLPPPYRARAARQHDDVWAVQARRIVVMAVPNAPAGDAIELTPDGLTVDGERTFGSIPELQPLGEIVRAQRLDGDLWEIQADRL
jgi:hypothetical protein